VINYFNRTLNAALIMHIPIALFVLVTIVKYMPTYCSHYHCQVNNHFVYIGGIIYPDVGLTL